MRWIPFVMVRVTAFFVAGILVAIHFPSLVSPSRLTVFLTILALVYLLAWITLQQQPALRLTSGFIGLVLVFGLGYTTVWVRDESQAPGAFGNVDVAVMAYRVQLVSPIDVRATRFRGTGELLSVKTDRGWISASGKVMLYWKKSERPDTLRYGDQLLVRGRPDRVPGPMNPGAFDYRAFLARKNIFHQHFLQPGTWFLSGRSTSRGPMYYATEARRWILDVINRVVRGDREQAIVAAFVIGVTDEIDDDLRQAYAAGGAMHALAVSGMHVSILYGILLLACKPIEQRRGGSWMVAGLSLLVLWMFGFVTGLSPSVLRAVTMFSFVALAKPLKRISSIYNTLAASAFLLLIFDPWLILAAGFQLSYLAVLGIVLFYRPIYLLWEAPSVWADWTWQITCVSLAAQLATLPVTLYYFHQFPVYFLLANLFVIPASTLILLGGLILLMVSPITWCADAFARVLEWMIRLLNEGLFLVGKIPGGIIQPIHLSFTQACCLGVITLAIFCLFRYKKFRWAWLAFVACVVFGMEDWYNRESYPVFTVYHVPRHAAMEWRSRGTAWTVVDTTLRNDPAQLAYQVHPAHLAARARHAVVNGLSVKCGVTIFQFAGKSFLHLGDPGFRARVSLAVNYVIIGNNAVRSLETLTGSLTFGYLILDSSNSKTYVTRIIEEAKKAGIRYHAVTESGAFVTELE